MIKSISIHNFKLFLDVHQDLKKLTLLTGLNGRGKSSFIQAILLAWNSFQGGDARGLALKNSYIDLGTVDDIVPWNGDDLKMEICLVVDEDTWSSTVENFDSQTSSDNYIKTTIKDTRKDPQSSRYYLQYLSTYRMGNLSSFPNNTRAAKEMRSLSISGGDGMGTAQFLDLYGAKAIPIAELAHPDEPSLRLDDQVNAWMRIINPDLRFSVSRSGGNYSIRYQDRLSTFSNTSANASNVGYGLTYSLPLFVALLSTPPGGTVIMETPEAHLHPAAQAAFMDLVCIAAAHGVQIIVETHSDYVINGTLRNLKDKKINVEDVSILFFDRDIETGLCEIVRQNATQQGRIKNASQGFFDQYVSDMHSLL